MESKKKKIAELTEKTGQGGFWDDAQAAGAVLRELESLRSECDGLEKMERDVADTSELLFSVEDLSPEEAVDFAKQLVQLEEEVGKLEMRSLLGGEYDRSGAIVTIHAGAGGVDAQDWAEMLLRMYLRWAERKGFVARVVDESRGTEAGIKSVTFEVEGAYAYGYLRAEAGVHRLVRLSPFNSDNLRQTSFAQVEVLPVIEDIAEVPIALADLRIDTFRASGAGGQHVNTTDSAVRITHIPTGVVVSCQSERSQMQNRERAMRVLKAKLHQKFLEEQQRQRLALRGEYKSAEWGSQIRSYVVHPYKMVKDHRTKQETSNAEAVLDGELDPFIEAYLRFAASGGGVVE